VAEILHDAYSKWCRTCGYDLTHQRWGIGRIEDDDNVGERVQRLTCRCPGCNNQNLRIITMPMHRVIKVRKLALGGRRGG
jgi:Zn finger protein HypA/HybF involved in hydrogenase expression